MLYSVKGFFEINENIAQILLILKVLFTQDSEVEDLLYYDYSVSPVAEPSQFFSNNLFSLGLEPVQDDVKHDFTL